jgi:hypothetical protein
VRGLACQASFDEARPFPPTCRCVCKQCCPASWSASDRKEIVIKRDSPAIANGDYANKTLIEERPHDAPYTQRCIVRASEYSRWARCIACGGIRFSGIKRTRSDGKTALLRV